MRSISETWKDGSLAHTAAAALVAASSCCNSVCLPHCECGRHNVLQRDDATLPPTTSAAAAVYPREPSFPVSAMLLIYT